MAKQSIFSRMSQLVRANVNTMLDKAEDPEKMLDQMVHDFTSNIREAEESSAQVIGNLRMMESDHQDHVENVNKWHSKAIAATQRAEDHRSRGEDSEAQRFDNLARVAMQRQMESEDSARNTGKVIESQRGQVENLKTGLNQMRQKREQLVSRRDELVARSRTAETQQQVQNALGSLDSMDPTSEIGRFEESVRKQEALTRGQQELALSSLDNQFSELEDMGEDPEIEARLEALKQENRKEISPSKENKD